MNKKAIALTSLAGVATLGVLGMSSVFAAESLGTVTGRDGDVLEKVLIEAEVVSADGSQVTIQDTETGDSYDTAFGPTWYTGTYAEGDQVTVEGVVTSGDNDKGHDFQTTKVGDTEIRSEFEGKPAWAGTRGNGNNGEQQGSGQGSMNGGSGNGGQQNFIDADGDGVCDNLK